MQFKADVLMIKTISLPVRTLISRQDTIQSFFALLEIATSRVQTSHINIIFVRLYFERLAPKTLETYGIHQGTDGTKWQ